MDTYDWKTRDNFIGILFQYLITRYCNACTHVCIQGCMEGGFLGFQETPFHSKTISKITYLNKHTIINILATYAYLSANTI